MVLQTFRFNEHIIKEIYLVLKHIILLAVFDFQVNLNDSLVTATIFRRSKRLCNLTVLF